MSIRTAPARGEVWLDAALFRRKRAVRELLIEGVGPTSAEASALTGGAPGVGGVPLERFRTDLVWQGWWSNSYERLPVLQAPFAGHPFEGLAWARKIAPLTPSASIANSLVSSLTPSSVICLDRDQRPRTNGIGMSTTVSGIGAGIFYLRFDYEREYVRKGPASPEGLHSLFFQKQSHRWQLVRTLFVP